MSDELARLCERIRQNRAERARRIAAARESLAVNNTGASGTPTAGTRAIDLVTGEEVEIVHAARENIIVPTPKRRDG